MKYWKKNIASIELSISSIGFITYIFTVDKYTKVLLLTT